MGLQTFRLLRKHWGRMRMATKTGGGGYYKSAFRVLRVVTQGGQLYPTTFIIVVDAVVRHWVKVMLESAEKKGGCGQEGRHQDALFYADEGMAASLDLRWLKIAFRSL